MEDIAKTHTLEEFVSMKYQDSLTYREFSIIEKVNGLELIEHNLIDDYLDELSALCVTVTLSNAEYNKYKYAPDLLAYDVYGSTQLDFVILFANDMIDPKNFDLRSIKLPYASQMRSFLNDVYNSNAGYIEQNRADNDEVFY